MNPRDRKLRLRKNTIRDLTPDHASEVRGGWSGGYLCSIWNDCFSIFGPCPVPEPVTEVVTNCPDTGGCTESCPCSVPGGPWSNCIAC